MEPVKVLASGLTLEESKAKRQEKQAARYRHRLGYVSTSQAVGVFDEDSCGPLTHSVSPSVDLARMSLLEIVRGFWRL